jgi:hypothetical protein
MTNTSPAVIRDKSLRVLSVGSGHFSPRMLTAASLAEGFAAGFLALDSDLDSTIGVSLLTVMARHWTPRPDRVKFPAWLRIPKSSGLRG